MKRLVERLWPWRWVMTAVITAIILYLTLFPDPLPEEADLKIPGLDKLVHAIMFWALAAAIALDYCRKGRSFTPLATAALVITAMVATIFGALIEAAQHLMGDGRTADALDLAADAIGAILGVITARAFAPRQSTKQT